MNRVKSSEQNAPLVDYYASLGIEPTAKQEEIKAAFRRLALEYHPDKNPGDEKGDAVEFRKIREAYENLTDPTTKAAYDEARNEHTSSEPFFSTGPPPWSRFDIPQSTPLRAKPKRLPGETAKAYYTSSRYSAWLSSLPRTTSVRSFSGNEYNVPGDYNSWVSAFKTNKTKKPRKNARKEKTG